MFPITNFKVNTIVEELKKDETIKIKNKNNMQSKETYRLAKDILFSHNAI